MSLNNITLNLSNCIMSVANTELPKSEHQCFLCANLMSVEGNMSIALEVRSKPLLSYMEM